MTRLVMTRELAIDAATDAANRRMRAARRSHWNRTDFHLMAQTFLRLNPMRCECCGEPAGEGNCLCLACKESR